MVRIDAVTKVYRPMPRAMRLLLRTQVREPVTALDGISLDLGPGEVCVVIGANGAGKSTLFRILTGLTTPTEGSVSIAGRDATAEAESLRRRIGFAPAEERTLLLRHTCRENLAFHGRMQGLRGSSLAARIDEVLQFVGLAEATDRAAFALSTGMRARLQLARALLHDPEVLVLDEPTSAIDPVSARSIIRLVVKAASDRGAAVLLSSHRLEEIEELGDRVLLLDRGRSVFQGGLETFRRRYASPVLEVELADEASAAAAAAHAQAAGVVVRRPGGNPRSIWLEGVADVGEAFGHLPAPSLVVAIRDRSPGLLDVLERSLTEVRV